MLFSLRKTSVKLWTNTTVQEILIKDGRVAGAIVEQGARQLGLRARQGVILATGGFPHNPEMVRRYSPDHPHRFAFGFERNRGDGIRVGTLAGGVVDTDLSSPALWMPASAIRDSDGEEIPIPYGLVDRGRPGVIAVNAKGRRFVNESNSYHDIVTAIFTETATTGSKDFFFVCDARFVRRYGLGLIRPYPMTLSIKPFIKSGYITVYQTIYAASPTGLASILTA